MPELERFVGDNPIVGHNIGFDLSFLRKQGVFTNHTGIDTFELASILLPFAGRYSLTHLTDYLNVELPPDDQAHRACSARARHCAGVTPDQRLNARLNALASAYSSAVATCARLIAVSPSSCCAVP